MALGYEAFAAALEIADEGPFSGVQPHMSLEKPWLLVLFEALAKGAIHEFGGHTLASDDLVVGLPQWHLVVIGI